MSPTKLAALSLLLLAAVACSKNNDEKIVDKSGASTQETPAEYPKATGAWNEARTFMMKQDNEDEECDQIDFRVMANSGIFSVNECDKTKSGQLAGEEFVRLDRLATKAYQQTEGTVCPEIFHFDKYYATIDASNDEFDRNFDPDGSCYNGSEAVVTSYRTYLRQLLDKYHSAEANRAGL